MLFEEWPPRGEELSLSVSLNILQFLLHCYRRKPGPGRAGHLLRVTQQ